MAKRNGEEYVVVKGAIPRTLKTRFKVLCIENDLEMSAVLEDLIKKWIQANAPVSDFLINLSNQDCEDVKGYIPKSLKLQFKSLCAQKRVKIRCVLYELINQWVHTDGEK
ncbi:hypothetical protein BZZ01_00265 [Nostocales cyanobacterium HT-58-2]|nr:hypothetical protein BZZ01_00265 [Nostocales cyanobacterium HT-58-2]